MSLSKPYHRNYRAIKQGPNSGYSNWAYIRDKEYSKSPSTYIRAFNLIQDDLKTLFEYIEPSPESLQTYSFRTHELLMRACIELEANFKAILNENIYTPKLDRYQRPILNMNVYKKINVTHHLSSYEVELPMWHGPRRVIKPFESWQAAQGKSPDWYGNYNASKHDRQDEFKKANMESLISAVSGLLIVISSQFRNQDFSPSDDLVSFRHGDPFGFDSAIGSLFRIKYPNDWSATEIYDFDWNVLSAQQDRFAKIDFDQIP